MKYVLNQLFTWEKQKIVKLYDDYLSFVTKFKILIYFG